VSQLSEIVIYEHYVPNRILLPNITGGDNSENLEKAIGNIPGIGLAASNGSCFSPPITHGQRTWLAFDLGVDWDSVKRVSECNSLLCIVMRLHSSLTT
jgi:hypothetical protein